MTISELLESSEGLVEPATVRTMDARRWEKGARSRQTREAGAKTTMYWKVILGRPMLEDHRHCQLMAAGGKSPDGASTCFRVPARRLV